jgi:hypothetical protein
MLKTIRSAMCLLLVLVSGCSKPPAGPAPVQPNGPVEVVPSFVNRVWRVTAATNIPPGSLYAFLSDGTLVVTSPTTKAALGMWTFKNNVLTLVQEGVPLAADIVKLDSMELQIKMRPPAEPFEVAFRLAEDPMPEKQETAPPAN